MRGTHAQAGLARKRKKGAQISKKLEHERQSAHNMHSYTQTGTP